MKVTLNAFLPEFNVEMYKHYSRMEQPREMVNCLSFSTCEEFSGWIPMGTAEIELTLPTDQELIPAQVAVLQAQKKALQAEAQSRVNQIEERIQSLLCLEAPK